MNKLRSKRITLTLCETLIYKPQNPKPSCAEIRSSLTRRPRQTLPCAEPSCSRGDLDRPSSAQNLPAHEATSTGPPVRRTSPPAHEANSTGSPVRQNKPSCSRGDLDRPSRAQNKPSCSRGDLDRPSRAPEQAFLLTRRPRQTLPCARTSLPAHEATSTGSPVRRTSLPAHEATSTGSPVRQKVTFAHETDEYDGRCAGRTLSRTENHSKGRQSIGR